MSKKSKIGVLSIDMLNDFMNQKGASLSVPGAVEDAQRFAHMIFELTPIIDNIAVILDSHHPVDIGHAPMWLNADGSPLVLPSYYDDVYGENRDIPLVIAAADLEAGIYRPRNANYKQPALGGKMTVGEYMIHYAQTLESVGKHRLMVWPTHCLISSVGATAQKDMFEALTHWAVTRGGWVQSFVKGTNPYTEHYSGYKAEFVLSSDRRTGPNVELLKMLEANDVILCGGEALSHCVNYTISDIIDALYDLGGDAYVKKLWLCIDAMSSVIAPGIDFPAISAAFLKYAESRGAKLTTTVEVLDTFNH